MIQPTTGAREEREAGEGTKSFCLRHPGGLRATLLPAASVVIL